MALIQVNFVSAALQRTVPVQVILPVDKLAPDRKLIIGGVETFLVAAFPSLSGYSDAFTFVLLILMLLVRPTGLLGEKMTDKV